MAHAFILSDDTVLCRQMPDGWWPLQIQLPQSRTGSDEQAYRLGHVTLHESLSPNHWQSDDNNNMDENNDNDNDNNNDNNNDKIDNIDNDNNDNITFFHYDKNVAW